MNAAQHKYPPMLGSPDDVPVGSPEWAERQGNRIKIVVEHLGHYGMAQLLPEIEKTLDANPRPWVIWPVDNPCRTPDEYFRYAAGISCKSLADLIRAYYPTQTEIDKNGNEKKVDHPLVRKLLAKTAEDNPKLSHAEAGKKGGRGNKAVTNSHGFSSTSIKGILRRLAPDILAAYERGEFKSARAAGIAAGIIKPPTAFDKICRLWCTMSDDEKDRFLKWKDTNDAK